MACKLKREFYLQDTQIVARELLGKQLVRTLPSGRRIAGKIVETEAYLGPEDPGAHVYQWRRTARVQSMYLEGGHAYVYFTYGNHFCINAVTQKQGRPEAVLLRALEPTEGLTQMRRNRGKQELRELTSGPGKLCQALGIDRRLDGADLRGSKLFIEDVGVVVRPDQIAVSARIGLGCEPRAASWPLRYYIDKNQYVSKRTKNPQILGHLDICSFDHIL